MRKHILFCTVILLLAFPFPVLSKEKVKFPFTTDQVDVLQELHIGDKMPDIVLYNLLNNSSPSAKLSDLIKGRYLIIDFFATWCIPCVRALPALNQLQLKYADQLKIIGVSNQPTSTVAAFLKTNISIKGTSLPFVTDDRVIETLFPHHLIPHDIWIDRNGIVKAVTSELEITDENVHSFLNGALKALPLKQDVMGFTHEVPLFKNGNGGNGNEFTSRSILTPNLDGLPSGGNVELDKNKMVTKVLMLNSLPISMLYNAYSRFQFGANNFKRMILSPSDSMEQHKIIALKRNDTARLKLLHSYEYIPARPETWDVAFKSIMEDLNRYFDITGTIEKRTIPCWILTLKDKNLAVINSSDTRKVYGDAGKFHNVPVKYLISRLHSYSQMEPIVDETSYDQPVFMDITFDPALSHYPDIMTIRSELNKYGFDLVKGQRSIDVLVIHDRD